MMQSVLFSYKLYNRQTYHNQIHSIFNPIVVQPPFWLRGGDNSANTFSINTSKVVVLHGQSDGLYLNLNSV